jgi:hypothetical protein
MGLPPRKYVQDGQEGVYHCFTRCIRRAFPHIEEEELCRNSASRCPVFSHNSWADEDLPNPGIGTDFQISKDPDRTLFFFET